MPLREHGETRQLGGLAFFYRKHRGVLEAMLFKDQGKQEASAGLPAWYDATPKLGLPGGGRGMQEPNCRYPENLRTTLQSEIREEIGIRTRQLFVNVPNHQVVPFIVGQLHTEGINEFAVTSGSFDYDNLSVYLQRQIDIAEEANKIQWRNLQDLVSSFHLFSSLVGFQHMPQPEVRPQVLTAAFIWNQSLCEHIEPEVITQNVIPMNQQTHQFLYSEAKKMKLPVNNGTFQPDGNLIPARKMDFRTRRFLGVK